MPFSSSTRYLYSVASCLDVISSSDRGASFLVHSFSLALPVAPVPYNLSLSRCVIVGDGSVLFSYRARVINWVPSIGSALSLVGVGGIHAMMDVGLKS